MSRPLGSIGSVPCRCWCGWSGKVEETMSDVDGDGNLGCPLCWRVVQIHKFYANWRGKLRWWLMGGS